MENALLTGSSGAGKTCVACYAVLEPELTIESQYVDCCTTPESIRHRILEGVTLTYDVHHSMLPDELLRRIKGLGTPCVVIREEVDKITDTAGYAPCISHDDLRSAHLLSETA